MKDHQAGSIITLCCRRRCVLHEAAATAWSSPKSIQTVQHTRGERKRKTKSVNIPRAAVALRSSRRKCHLLHCINIGRRELKNEPHFCCSEWKKCLLLNCETFFINGLVLLSTRVIYGCFLAENKAEIHNLRLDGVDIASMPAKEAFEQIKLTPRQQIMCGTAFPLSWFKSHVDKHTRRQTADKRVDPLPLQQQ